MHYFLTPVWTDDKRQSVPDMTLMGVFEALMNNIMVIKDLKGNYEWLLILFTRHALLGFFEKIICQNYSRFLFKKIVVDGVLEDSLDATVGVIGPAIPMSKVEQYVETDFLELDDDMNPAADLDQIDENKQVIQIIESIVKTLISIPNVAQLPSSLRFLTHYLFDRLTKGGR